MARTSRSISIDGKIEKAQDRVVRAKARYDDAVAGLKQLTEKKAAIQKNAIMNAVASSSKSYEEILEFLSSDGK
jgi:hypothetical protein